MRMTHQRDDERETDRERDKLPVILEMIGVLDLILGRSRSINDRVLD